MAMSGLQGLVDPQLGYIGAQRDRALQRQLGNKGLDLQRELGLGGLDLGWAGHGLAAQQQNWAQNTQWTDMLAQQGLDRDLQRELQKAGIDANKRSWWEKGLGAIGGGIGIASGVKGLFS
jgi:hypothetical protein